VATVRRLGEILRGHGFRASPGVAGIALLPARVANAAGLGWIGKCGRFVTPQIGPRLALSALLTDAPLPLGADAPTEPRCFDCHACIDVCPAHALTSAELDPADPFATYDREKCLRYRCAKGAIGAAGACGRCIAACVCGRRAAVLLREPGQTNQNR
jgi:epoxyqueuosine reductase QueG